MSTRSQRRSLLLVEDDFIIAADLAYLLESAGIDVIGPVGSVEEALDVVESDCDRIDGAVLDINVRGVAVYPVANALARRGIPFLFTTGYDAGAIPGTYAAAPRCEKPVDKAQLLRWL